MHIFKVQIIKYWKKTQILKKIKQKLFCILVCNGYGEKMPDATQETMEKLSMAQRMLTAKKRRQEQVNQYLIREKWQDAPEASSATGKSKRKRSVSYDPIALIFEAVIRNDPYEGGCVELFVCFVCFMFFFCFMCVLNVLLFFICDLCYCMCVLVLLHVLHVLYWCAWNVQNSVFSLPLIQLSLQNFF